MTELNFEIELDKPDADAKFAAEVDASRIRAAIYPSQIAILAALKGGE